jgi:hypothetical protein
VGPQIPFDVLDSIHHVFDVSVPADSGIDWPR